MDAAGAWRPATAALPEELALITFNPSDVDRTERARLTLTLPGGGADYEVVDAAGQPIPHRWLGEHGESSTIMELPAAEVPDAETVLAQIPGDRVMDMGVHDVRVGIEGDAVVADLTLGEQSVLTRGEIEEAVRYTGRLIEQAQSSRAVLRIHRSTRLELEFLARDVPAHGYRTAWLQRTTQRPPSTGHHAPDAAHDEVSTEWFAVRVDPADGTLTITDRRDGGTVYARCNVFVDGGDAGDTYTFAPPAKDTVVSAPAGPPRVTIEDDPLGATLRVALDLRVPAALAASRGRRSPTMVTLPLVSTVQLTHGVPRIDVTTTLENTARDHRLRVGFTAPFATDHAHAEGAFAVTRRPLALPGQTEGWAEQPAPTAPQQGFLAVHGRAQAAEGGAETPLDVASLDLASLVERALLVTSQGLPEYEVRSEAGQTEVLLTVLRAVGWLSRDDLSTRAGHAGPGLPAPEAQCAGTHMASYTLLPWAGDWHAAIPLARAAAAALTTVAVPAGAAAIAAEEERPAEPASMAAGRLPASGAFLRVTPACVSVSALKGAEDGRGLILRLCNLSASAVEARVEWGLLAAVLRRVTRTSLAEVDEDALPVQHTPDGGTALELGLRPWEIASLRLERGA
jgi:alpha-mannosidase